MRVVISGGFGCCGCSLIENKVAIFLVVVVEGGGGGGGVEIRVCWLSGEHM